MHCALVSRYHSVFSLPSSPTVRLYNAISFWPRYCHSLTNMARDIIRFNWDKPSSLSFEPDSLAPEQYLKNHRRTHPAEPEKRLMFAVLAEGVETYQKFAFSNSPRAQVLFRETEAWFRGEEADSVFSFRSICEVLSLDPAFVRHGLMQWTVNQQRYLSPRKKIQLHLETGRARKAINGLGKKAASNHLGKVRACGAASPRINTSD